MTTQIIPGIKHIGLTDANKQRKNRSADKTYLPLPCLPIPGAKHAGYEPALELVARIDEDLTRGVRHYRTKAGLLLVTLDQVIVAILANNLTEPEEATA